VAHQARRDGCVYFVVRRGAFVTAPKRHLVIDGCDNPAATGCAEAIRDGNDLGAVAQEDAVAGLLTGEQAREGRLLEETRNVIVRDCGLVFRVGDDGDGAALAREGARAVVVNRGVRGECCGHGRLAAAPAHDSDQLMNGSGRGSAVARHFVKQGEFVGG
jgi:hypothetical protein